jgi:hypothetical protein
MNFMLSKNLTVLTITIIQKAKNEAEIVQDTSRIIHSLGWMAEIQTNQGDYTGSKSV